MFSDGRTGYVGNGGIMALILGLLIGIAFGFVLKKSRICYMGTIRDIS